MAFLEDPTAWTAIALVLFFAILAYYGVPGTITKSLDAKRFAIREELDDARKLREEAQNLLASNQRRQRDAAGEVEEILTSARNEADRAIADAQTELDSIIQRRRQSTGERIARAEAQAVVDIRSFVAGVAVSAARQVVASQMNEERDAKLVANATDELDTRLRSA